jgi:hypothetical protein
MTKVKSRNLERVKYWQGQMLRSQDFLNTQEVEAQRRWWHNRAVHNAYGVAEGLDCSLIPAAAPTGVSIFAGVAYDVFGRELILETPLIIPMPTNVPQGLIGAVSLLMRYKPPSGGMRPDDVGEVCWSARESFSTGTVEFVWKLGDRLDPADGVPVYAVYYNVGGLKGPDPYFNRVSMQPLAGPLLASGATIPGATAWEPWIVGFVEDDFDNFFPNVIGVQTWIDTSAAGFSAVPCYFATLQGALWSPNGRKLVPAIFPSLADESVTGFTFRLWLQMTTTLAQLEAGVRTLAATPTFSFATSPADFVLYAQQQGLYVSWTGCQMQAPVSCTTSAPSVSLGEASVASTLLLNS